MKYVYAFGVALLLSACGAMNGADTSANSSADNSQRPSMEQLGRMPLPVGTKLRTNESLIFGVGDGWLGRAILELPIDETSSYNYFTEQMPRQGWSLISSVRGKRSLLVFRRGDRSATIELEGSNLFGGGTAASLLMSPIGGNSAMPAGNAGGVVVQPLGGAARRP